MNTRFLETFVTLARLESFRATAQLLHATPATISLRIRSLEDELKCTLIDRSASQFRLTQSGSALLGLAKRVVDTARALREAAGQGVAIGGKLRLGVIETIVHSWLAQYVAYLKENYPKLEIDMTVGSSSSLQKQLLSGDLDIAIRAEGIDSPRIVSNAIASYPVRWIAKRGLISRRGPGLAQRVLQYPILTFGRGSAPQVALENIVCSLAKECAVPAEQINVTCLPSVTLIVQLARDGYGVAAIPSLFVADALRDGSLIELPLKPSPPPIIVSVCKPVHTTPMIDEAANAARVVCSVYSRSFMSEFIEAFDDTREEQYSRMVNLPDMA